MKTHPSSRRPEKNPASQVINCTDCHTPDHLIIESIEPLLPGTNDSVAVEYSCGKCESFYAHEVPVQEAANFLAPSEPGDTDDAADPGDADGPAGQLPVLKLGRLYIHCGEAMEEASLTIAGVEVLEDHLPAAVMQCHCGFQLVIQN